MYGTLSITDLLGETSGNVVDFGEARIWEAFQASLQAHNAIVQENLGEFVEVTTDELRGTSGYDRMEMEQLDEFGVPGAQKVVAGGNLGFPIRFSGIAIQWTRLTLRKATPAALAAQFNGMREADVRGVLSEVRRALYSPTNYSFKDRRDPRSPTLPVKALANADDFFIPLGPNGEQFDAGTHSHYLAAATLTTTAVDGLVTTVREHFNTGEIRLVINVAQESAMRGLSGFTPYVDARIRQPLDATYATGANLDVANPYNRPIGIYNGCEVWVKPWAIANYLLAYRRMGGMNGRKVLAMRRADDGTGNLEILFQDEQYPLRAEAMGREYGIAVQDRIGAAALMIGGTTYAAPSKF